MMLSLQILGISIQMLKRTSFMLLPVSILGLFSFTWPLFLPDLDNSFLHGDNAKYVAALLLPVALLLFLIEINHGALDARAVALLGVFSAIISALRLVGAGAIGIEPIWFFLILVGRVFGPSFGFTLGVISIFISGLISGGIGPWLAFQMLAGAWVAMFAGLLPKRITGKMEIFLLTLYAVIATQVFGILMNLQLWPWLLGTDTQLSFVAGDSVLANLHRFFIFHVATSLAWDIPRAVFTVILIITTATPILVTLKRAKIKLSTKTSEHSTSQKVA